MLELKAVPQGKKVLGACRTHLQPGIDDVQSVISSVWNGSINLKGVFFSEEQQTKKQIAKERKSKRPRNHITCDISRWQASHRTGEALQQVQDHKFKALTDDLLLFCKRLEGHELLWKQMAFAKMFMGLAKQACQVQKLVDKDAAGRKMNSQDVDFISESRKIAVNFQTFVSEHNISLKPDATPLFPATPLHAQGWLLPQVAKAWDISGAEGWVACIRNGTNTIIDGWIADVHGVCKLTESYDVSGWEIAKDTLFKEELFWVQKKKKQY